MVKLLRLPGEAATAEATQDHLRDDGGTEGGAVLRGHTGTVREVCYPSPSPSHSPGEPSSAGSERLLSVGAGDFACRLWDIRGGPAAGGGQGDGMAPLAVLRGHTDTVFSCSMSPGGNVREPTGFVVWWRYTHGCYVGGEEEKCGRRRDSALLEVVGGGVLGGLGDAAFVHAACVFLSLLAYIHRTWSRSAPGVTRCCQRCTGGPRADMTSSRHDGRGNRAAGTTERHPFFSSE